MPDDRNSNGQTTLAQWRSLDESPRSRRRLGQSPLLGAVGQLPSGPIFPLIAALVVAVLICVTLYIGWLVRASIRESIRDSLEAVLSANTSALEFWLTQQRQAAIRFASDKAVQSVAFHILDQPAHPSRGTGEETMPAAERLDAVTERFQLTNQLQSGGYEGWAIIDPLGTVLLCASEGLIGRQLPLGKDGADRLAAGRAFVTPPVDMKGWTEDVSISSAVMFAIAPLRRDMQTTGAIALLIDPVKQFSERLAIARLGETGETYAIDRDAAMLSRSRFEPQLIRCGLLQEGESSPLRIKIRQPGIDIRTVTKVPGDARTWPMTRMADSVTRGGQGFDVVGYNNYRGVPVVGAWSWIPEHEFGLATEMDVEEAFVPLRVLRNSLLALLGVVALAVSGLFASAWIAVPRKVDSPRVEELTRRLGQYDLQQPIGRGGMGTVFLGSHRLLDRKVAIKVLENADVTKRSLARFQREVQLSASLQHPNTIEIYDFGRTEEGTFFYVMEFVDGISLEQLVDYYGRQPAERVIYLLLQICGSLSEAHSAGMVHRDIKPANVLLTSRCGIHDLVKVLDFGLAKQLDHDSMQLTQVDSLTGTPHYMSPESIRDATSAGVLSDVYSVGAVGYTLICGFPPFSGSSSIDVLAKKLNSEPELPERKIKASLARDLQKLLLRCLSLDPERRPQSTQQLAKDLLACVDSPHWTQQDAALWWREVFDGPYLDDFDINDLSKADDGTQGETAVNDKRPAASELAQSTAS